MDDFGVRPARLRAQALRPAFPVPAPRVGATPKEAAVTLQGLTLKSVETLGEQSAAGLPSIAGVLVLEVEAGSPGEAAGFRPRDVIVGAGHSTHSGFEPIADLASFQSLWAPSASGQDRGLVVVRNQARILLRWPHAEITRREGAP